MNFVQFTIQLLNQFNFVVNQAFNLRNSFNNLSNYCCHLSHVDTYNMLLNRDWKRIGG